MSPILLRPVREQLEHDRVIRLLQAKYKRKFEVAINPGNEQTAPITIGQSPWYPDLVLQSQERSRKMLGLVEVETAESVNNLEAMSQWANFARQRVPFHLYVPAVSIDTVKRLCADLQIPVAELWVYSVIGDQVRFTLVQRASASRPAEEKARTAARAARPVPARRPAAAAAARTRPSRPPRRTAVTAPRGKAPKKAGARAASTRASKSTARPSRQKRK